jgi:hypothetical protein
MGNDTDRYQCIAGRRTSGDQFGGATANGQGTGIKGNSQVNISGNGILVASCGNI